MASCNGGSGRVERPRLVLFVLAAPSCWSLRIRFADMYFNAEIRLRTCTSTVCSCGVSCSSQARLRFERSQRLSELISKGVWRQGIGSFVRNLNSYVSTLCPVVICPPSCISELVAIQVTLNLDPALKYLKIMSLGNEALDPALSACCA